MSADGDLVLSGAVRAQVRLALRHVGAMQRERAGWGLEAMAQADRTAKSLLSAIGYLLNADEVWADPFIPLAFGGVTSGVTFGMIARERGNDKRFEYPEVEWTPHT